MRPCTLAALAAVGLAAAIPTGIGAAAPKHGAQTPSTITTCVNKKTGAMRLVSSIRARCRKSERRVSWAASGAGALVAGPPGATGPTGATGPAGANGTSGGGAPAREVCTWVADADATPTHHTICRNHDLVYFNILGGWGKNADFSGSELAFSSVQPSDFSGANFTGADLARASFMSSNFTSANFTGANLAGAYLVNSNLTGANLTGANLTGAVLGGANLTGVTWSNTTCPDGTVTNTGC